MKLHEQEAMPVVVEQIFKQAREFSMGPETYVKYCI